MIPDPRFPRLTVLSGDDPCAVLTCVSVDGRSLSTHLPGSITRLARAVAWAREHDAARGVDALLAGFRSYDKLAALMVQMDGGSLVDAETVRRYVWKLRGLVQRSAQALLPPASSELLLEGRRNLGVRLSPARLEIIVLGDDCRGDAA